MNVEVLVVSELTLSSVTSTATPRMCKYRVRWFYSKGAFLVLVWNFLISSMSIDFALKSPSAKIHFGDSFKWLYVCPFLVVMFSALVSGWLADAKVGNYRVVKAGLVLLFVSLILGNSLYVLIESCVVLQNTVLVSIGYIVLLCLVVIGGSAYLGTSLQLGLDQMPDASSSNITSFIAWFLCSIYLGLCPVRLVQIAQTNCVQTDSGSVFSYPDLWLLIPSLCLSIALIIDFLLARKWMIIEPKSSQSLKTIYQVLKFAAKHKAPLNRSAFTYWEEDIPSRLDLGKSKYGGPFTTEQVEDVKTILRLLVVSVPIWIILSAAIMRPYAVGSRIPVPELWTVCTREFVLFFVQYTEWWLVIGTVVFEFIVFPLFQDRLPGIFKRIGIASFTTVFVILLLLLFQIVEFFHSEENGLWITGILYTAINSFSMHVLLVSIFELVCAQSPYKMRGLFAGYALFLFTISILVGEALSGYTFGYTMCISNHKTCSLIMIGVKTAISLFGFLLFCVLARWYKMRVRDESYDAHRIVEETYDRYLTAAQNLRQ